MITTAFLTWWGTLPPARRWVLTALALLFFSQFLLYHANGNYGIAMADGHGGLVTGISFDPPHTGWEEHSLARLVIPALLVMHISLLRFKPFWIRGGYGISIALMLLFGIIMGPDSPDLDTWGVRLGLLSLALAGYACYLDVQARKQTA